MGDEIYVWPATVTRGDLLGIWPNLA